MRFGLIAVILALSCASCAGRLDTAPAPAAVVYRLAPDDKVKVTVYGENELSGQYLVGSDGKVSFPLIGMVPASGMTLAEFQATLSDRLATRYLNHPKVTADLIEYRPFYILGEVNRAGQYPYRVGLTIDAAVATAGGFTYRASHGAVAIQHRSEAEEHRYKVTPGLLVSPGDTIRVLERYF